MSLLDTSVTVGIDSRSALRRNRSVDVRWTTSVGMSEDLSWQRPVVTSWQSPARYSGKSP